MSIFSQLFRGKTNNGVRTYCKESQENIENKSIREDTKRKQIADLPKILANTAKVLESVMGDKDKINIRIEIPDRFVKSWFFTVRCTESDHSEYSLMLSAEFPDDDRYARPMAGYSMSVYMFTGTKQEIIDYLISRKGIEEVAESIDHLDRSVEKHE